MKNQKISSLLQLIESSPPILTQELEKAVSVSVSKSGIDQTDVSGTTLLHAACNAGNLPLVRWLVKHAANIERTDKHGFTPFLSAISNANTKVCFQYSKVLML